MPTESKKPLIVVGYATKTNRSIGRGRGQLAVVRDPLAIKHGAVDVRLNGLVVVRPDKQIAIIHERWRERSNCARKPLPAQPSSGASRHLLPEGEGMVPGALCVPYDRLALTRTGSGR
jgi:hypothetical protein